MSTLTVSGKIAGLLLASLRVEDDRLNYWAFELCEAIGPPIQPLLIRDLRTGKHKPDDRARLIRAIARTGDLQDPLSFFDFIAMASSDKSEIVRQAAARLVTGLPGHRQQAASGHAGECDDQPIDVTSRSAPARGGGRKSSRRSR